MRIKMLVQHTSNYGDPNKRIYERKGEQVYVAREKLQNVSGVAADSLYDVLGV